MLIRWLRDRRRKRLLATPFPDHWNTFLERNVAHWRRLSPEEQSLLRDRLRMFIHEKYWEGCLGLTVTEEMQVTIAAVACLLVLGRPGEPLAPVKSLLIYPSTFVKNARDPLPGGVIDESPKVLLGEAWHRGPVILSWEECRQDARGGHPGRNVILHEFAHVLDTGDDLFDGTPLLDSPEDYRTWAKVMTREYHRLVAAAASGRWSLIDDYGAQNEAEFFAVATECFFEQPVQMQSHHPQLYDLLKSYYRQDPAARVV